MTQARVLIGSSIALLIALLAAIGWFQWRAAKGARERAVVAEQGQDLATRTTDIVERTGRVEVVVRQEAERQVDAIQKAPGAGDVLDPAFRDQLRHGIGVMRGEAKASDDPGSSDVEGTLP